MARDQFGTEYKTFNPKPIRERLDAIAKRLDEIDASNNENSYQREWDALVYERSQLEKQLREAGLME